MKMLSDFKAFVLRGNVVDLAVGLVIGAAFQGVVQSFVKDILTPVISIPSKTDFFNAKIVIHGSSFLIGDFINSIISFVILAAVIFFFVVRPINMLMTFGKRMRPDEITKRECPECRSSIPANASRCAFCTAPVQPLTGQIPIASAR